ncbi:MAG: DUF1461 domain-containing protein [Gammaproteobacteria bacterium]
MSVTRITQVRGRIFCLLLLLPAAALGSLFLAWRLLAVVDFMYPTIYEVAGIGGHIEKYAPLNRYRDGFELTTREEHQRLFGDISTAIRDGGNGLGSLVYQDSRGETLGVLLRPAEIIHLTDVAKLVGLLERAGLIALCLLAVVITAVRRLRIRLPTPTRLFALTACGLFLVSVGITIAGPVDVFYGLHRWIFPSGNQWFFFYEESLMSTLMKAPDLFGYIAVVLLAVALLFFWLILWSTSRLCDSTSSQVP